MNKLHKSINPGFGFAMLGAGAIGLVFAAIAMTVLLQLEPCPLCMFQRLLYLTTGLLLLLAAAWGPIRLWAGTLALFATAGGLATAAYQSWMQAFPARFMTCGMGVPTTPIEKLVDWLGQIWPWMFYAWGDCTSREWELLGLSLANWSGVAFLVLTLAVAWMIRATLKT